jgi:pimeloyl-ACP methyl ester carboxylesterase
VAVEGDEPVIIPAAEHVTVAATGVSFATRAADAAALLAHLGIERAHIAGHSTGAAIALQLASDRAELVHSLVLLEPPLMTVPAAGEFVERIGPALEAYGEGDRERAMAAFFRVVTSLEWGRCRQIVEQRVPGGVAQAVAGADTFFGSYLPALGKWGFGKEDAVRIAPARPLGCRHCYGSAVRRELPSAPELDPASRGVRDRRRRSPAAHPTARAGRPLHGAVPPSPPDRRDGEPDDRERSRGAAAG